MKTALPLTLMICIVSITVPAAGQTLSDRIEAVRAKRTQKETATKLKMLQALLYEEFTVTFDETPARDVVEYLKTALNIKIVARYSDDYVGHGIDPETPISLNADVMQALELLEQVLEQCSVIEPCRWQLRRGFLEVGTTSRLSVPTAREIRWYPIDELVYEAPDFDDAIDLRLESAFPMYGGAGYGYGYSGGFLGGGGTGGSMQFAPASSYSGPEQRIQDLIDLIVDVIEPDAWTVNGGNLASIRYRDGALIVNAPPYIHRQIIGYPRVPPPRPAPAAQTPPSSP